jgi:riboflavin biosynthesis pyrimidine reductase
VTTTLQPLGPAGAARSAAAVADALRLRDPATTPAGRPRVVAAMIASADGRASVDGRSGGLGHPADRELLRELRAGVDAVLVGSATLRAERYANLIDPPHRARRVAAGLPPQPRVATVARRLDVPADIGLFAEADAVIDIFAEAEGEVAGRGAEVHVHRFAAGTLRLRDALALLAERFGVAAVLCEGGPTLLRALVAEDCLDDLMLTVAPLLVAGDEPASLAGEQLRPPPRLVLREALRADDHLVLHYAAPR